MTRRFDDSLRRLGHAIAAADAAPRIECVYCNPADADDVRAGLLDRAVVVHEDPAQEPGTIVVVERSPRKDKSPCGPN